MTKALIISLSFLGLCACTPAAPPAQRAAAEGYQLSGAERAAIARKIWQNESGGTVNGLTAWNGGENFPSLGIGHFIWYKKGERGPFTESFPQFIRFAQNRGAQPPAVALQAGCPWPSRAHFQKNFNSPEIAGLRNWLAKSTTLQADFIIAKSRAALPKMLAAAAAGDRERIQSNYEKVASTGGGTYALIDYVNFKGEGINPTERYRGQGWGLLQVLSNMQNVAAGPAAQQEFARAAKKTLSQRVANAPKNENQWLPGWHNRCQTYAQPLR